MKFSGHEVSSRAARIQGQTPRGGECWSLSTSCDVLKTKLLRDGLRHFPAATILFAEILIRSGAIRRF
jgi:hypothetical protein